MSDTKIEELENRVDRLEDEWKNFKDTAYMVWAIGAIFLLGVVVGWTL